MLRGRLRIAMSIGVLGALIFAAFKLFGQQRRPATNPPPTAAAPWPPLDTPKADPAPAPPARAWVEPVGATCPTSHPVKAKLSSKIFHLPGMLNYERTRPDRCYADAAAAEGDGLRAAKR